MNIKIFPLILLVLFVSGCINSPTTQVAQEKSNDFINETLPLKVARLPLLNMDTVDTFSKYKTFADTVNDLIEILNEQSELFNIPKLDATRKSWGIISKVINEYGPLINNYNEVISSAKEFEKVQSKENLETFYLASGKFAFETAIIIGTVFYSAAYQGVGVVYRAVKLNKLAFKCPSCVSVILSNAHWFVRTVLVEGSSQLAQFILEEVSNMYKGEGVLIEIKGKASSLINSAKGKIDAFVNT